MVCNILMATLYPRTIEITFIKSVFSDVIIINERHCRGVVCSVIMVWPQHMCSNCFGAKIIALCCIKFMYSLLT